MCSRGLCDCLYYNTWGLEPPTQVWGFFGFGGGFSPLFLGAFVVFRGGLCCLGFLFVCVVTLMWGWVGVCVYVCGFGWVWVRVCLVGWVWGLGVWVWVWVGFLCCWVWVGILHLVYFASLWVFRLCFVFNVFYLVGLGLRLFSFSFCLCWLGVVLGCFRVFGLSGLSGVLCLGGLAGFLFGCLCGFVGVCFSLGLFVAHFCLFVFVCLCCCLFALIGFGCLGFRCTSLTFVFRFLVVVCL